MRTICGFCHANCGLITYIKAPDLHLPTVSFPSYYLQQMAAARGIVDSDMGQVKSPEGMIRIKARLTDEIAQGVILIDLGWGNPGDGG